MSLARNHMKHILIAFSVFVLAACRTDEIQTEEVKPQVLLSYQLDRSQEYTLVAPIPEGDQWLSSFKKAHGYGKGWQTWVWRKSSIKLGSGATVYARNQKEVQFLVTGLGGIKSGDICINFRNKNIGWEWGGSGMHITSVSPSKNYIVTITKNPHAFLSDGMSLKERHKADFGWDFEFVGDVARLWERGE